MPCRGSVSHGSWARGNVLSKVLGNAHVLKSGVCSSNSLDQRLPGQRDVPVEAVVAAQVSPAPGGAGGAAGTCPQCWAVRAVPGPVPSVLFPIWGIASMPAPCVVKTGIPAAIWNGISQC